LMQAPADSDEMCSAFGSRGVASSQYSASGFNPMSPFSSYAGNPGSADVVSSRADPLARSYSDSPLRLNLVVPLPDSSTPKVPSLPRQRNTKPAHGCIQSGRGPCACHALAKASIRLVPDPESFADE